MRKPTVKNSELSIDLVKEKIYFIRNKKVMLDKDLALLYGVSTKVLNQAVKRNKERFPADFMFQLTKEEMKLFLRSQIVTLKTGSGAHSKYLTFAFTEQGVAMLSSVLNSKKAIQVNIQIIRIFTKIREMIDSYKELREKVEEMERSNEITFRHIFKELRLLIKEKAISKGKLGFDTN